MGINARRVSIFRAHYNDSWLNFSVNSIEGMKNALPGLRRKLNTDPVYFKKVYMHTFDLAKAAGARTLAFDTGTSLFL